MRVEVVAAQRAKEVRDAARAWHRTGFIGEEVLSRIVSLYPDDRRRLGPGFRALAFIFAGVAALAMVGVGLIGSTRDTVSGLLLLWAVVMAFLTEFQRGPGRRASAGAESATALMAVLFAIGSVLLQDDGPFFSSRTGPGVYLAPSCAFCALAAWRWGDGLFFLGAGLSAFGLLAQIDQGRLLWIVVSLLIVPACLKAARDHRVGPSHRTGAMILGAISILALYGAIHIWSWDQRTIESMGTVVSSAAAPAAPAFRPLSILATALLPPSLLLIGWRRREPLLLYAGLLLIGVSIATIRLYHAIMPLSFALILIGAGCLTLALWVRRWVRSGENGERHGYTADPLFDNTNRTDAIKSVVAMASFTPAAQAPPSETGFRGGGGSFGGGGATGNY